jgi:MFS superfamily sulfate permease-like transporter
MSVLNAAKRDGGAPLAPGRRCRVLQTAGPDNTLVPVPFGEVFKASLRPASVVALVSLSLSISLGLASGTTPIAGLRTAIWGGFAGGAFGSSPYNIIGPAGALSGMLSKYGAQFGGPDILPWIALFSSAFTFLVWRWRLSRFLLFMPKAVFEGFTVGVALIIGLKQINFALGLSPAAKHAEFVANLWESLAALGGTAPGSVALFVPELAALLLLMERVPRVPWAVVLPGLTIVLGYLAHGSDGPLSAWALPTLRSQYGELSATVVSLPDVGALRRCGDLAGVLAASLSVSFVAVLETLISAKIAGFRADNLLFDERDETRMLAGATLLSGLCGGMPPTGVFVRTSLNVSLGATHRLAQFLNACLVLAITAVAMPIFAYLPLPSVAAVLATASIRMVPVPFLRQLWVHDRAGFWVCLLTALLCVALDPVAGLLAGMLLSFLIESMAQCDAAGTVRHLSHAAAVVGDDGGVGGGVGGGGSGGGATIELNGSIAFAVAERISLCAAGVAPGAAKVAVDLSRATAIDSDGANAIRVLVAKLGDRSSLRGMRPALERPMAAMTWYVELKGSGRVHYADDDGASAAIAPLQLAEKVV